MASEIRFILSSLSQGDVRKSKVTRSRGERRPKFGLLALTGSQGNGVRKSKVTRSMGERRPKFGFSALITGSTQGNRVRKSRSPDPWERDGVRNSVYLPL